MAPPLPVGSPSLVTPSRDIARLIEIMAALRTPGTGCPWDLVQDFHSIAPYTIEEAYEVVDAIARGDRPDLCEELGDLLLQVVFHSRMAEEEGAFMFGDVVEAITRKLIRRHPHVFGEARDLAPDAVKALWAEIKAQEKVERAQQRPGASPPLKSLLDTVPAGLPPLLRALKIQTKAATVGFDWSETRAVVDKIREELDEVLQAMAGDDTAAVTDEIGDLLFAVINLARHAGVDPDQALQGTNAKFMRRFGHVERMLARNGHPLAEAGLDAMEALWAEAKAAETATK